MKEKHIRQGLLFEYATLVWNVVGCIIVMSTAAQTFSLSLFGFGIDSIIEIFASVIVIWQLKAIRKKSERVATKMIGVAFIFLSAYIVIQSYLNLIHRHPVRPSLTAILWLAITAIVMFLLAYGKKKVGTALHHPVLLAESKVTVIDGLLALSVLIGLFLTTYLGWWWADIASSLIIVWYGLREAFHIFFG